MTTVLTARPGPAGTQGPKPVRRVRLRAWKTVDYVELAGAAAGSLCLTWLVYEQLTPLSGGLGFALSAFGCFLGVYWLMARERLGPNGARDRVAAAVVTAVGLVLVASLVVIVVYLAERGYHALTLHFFYKDQFGVGELAPPKTGGALAAIVGSAEQVGLATVISVPLGIATGVFLNEIRGPLARPVRLFTDAMSGIPSILAGLFIYGVLILGHLLPLSGFAVSLALAISMLPTVTVTTEVVLRLVPDDLREASFALGATEWRTVRRVLLPTAQSGLVTACILGVARIVGEAAPALIDAGGSNRVNYNPFSGQQDSLPLMIYTDIRSYLAPERIRAWTAALVLVILILILFTAARAIAGRAPGHIGLLRRRRLQRKGLL